MSIESAIENAQQKVANAYTAVDNKGGTLPATQNLSNLPTAINTISTAGTVEQLNVTPTTSAQQFVPTGGVDGYNPVNVSAVTSSIDANITAGNIKDGVTILGVTGNFDPSPTIDSLSVTPSTSAQTFTASGGVDGYSPVTVSAVTSDIDSDIKATNIKSGVTILGVTGSVTELAGETRTVSLTSSSSSGQTFTPSSGKNGITSITVKANNQARTVTPTTSQQSLTVNSGYSGNGTITVNAVTSAIDPNIVASNIKKDVVILGITGTYEGSGGGGGATLSYSWYLDDLEILNVDFGVEVEIIYNLLENDYTPDYDFVDCVFTFKDANGNDFAYSVVGYNFELEQVGSELYDDNIWVISFVIICYVPPSEPDLGDPVIGTFNLYIEKI